MKKILAVLTLMLIASPVMALDITLQIMAFPSTHTLPLEEEAVRYKRGDIVGVYLSSKVPEPPSLTSRSVFIRITDVPSTAIEKAKKLIREDIDANVLIRRRQYNIDPQSLPSGIKQKLLTDREVTVTWIQAKPYLIDMKTGLSITDGDIT